MRMEEYMAAPRRGKPGGEISGPARAWFGARLSAQFEQFKSARDRRDLGAYMLLGEPEMQANGGAHLLAGHSAGFRTTAAYLRSVYQAVSRECGSTMRTCTTWK